jgi:TonB family protein
MAPRNPLSDHLATRANSLDFTALGLYLPNPDPILKAQGKDIATYRDMRHDALVGSCIARRRASVQALEFGLDRGQASSRVAKAVQAMLDALPLSTIIEQIQDCALYGYQPMEVMWGQEGGLFVPVDVLAKPPEWFCFDANNLLRFKSRAQPLYGEELPDKKYLLPRNSPTYQNPYGFADLSMCYWPLLFKKGGLKFWLAFTEKFGGAFMTGKLPRSATPAERAEQEKKRREMLKLLAKIENRINAENARPRKRFLSPAVKEASYALYYDAMRQAIEARGTAHFPEKGGQKLYGSLTMVITVDHRGTVLDAEVVKASGKPDLDRRAQEIARKAGPFGAFTADMRKTVDQLVVVSRFTFTQDATLQTKAMVPP